jgi:hypothetical protein
MRILNIGLITIASALGAMAQDKVTVPISNPSQPVTIKTTMMAGSIKVVGGTGRDLVVTVGESGSARGRRATRDNVPPGMTRIGGKPGLDIEEDHNVVTISAGSMGGGADLLIETPQNANLQLHTMNPSIEVTGVNGDLEIENTNGSIKLTNVSGSVVAHTMNGSVTALVDRVTENKPMAITSMNGKVDVTLPADTKARLRLKTDNGSIFSDFDVKLETDAGKPVVEDSRSQNGKYKISIDRNVTGTINGGGPEYTFQTMNGNILIHKK